MAIKINEAACQALGAKLAEQSSSLRVLCENLHHCVTQARENFTEVRCYNGGYVRPVPLPQGHCEIYAAAEGYEFTIRRTETLGTPLAVIEEVLTKEMLTSYLYEICARVACYAATYHASLVYEGGDSGTQWGYDLFYQRDAATAINGYHIAALREDIQRSASFKDKAESLLHHARHNEGKHFEQWQYSQKLLKRARHEINKRGAKVNALKRENRELKAAVQHLAKENVELTEKCSQLQQQSIERAIIERGASTQGLWESHLYSKSYTPTIIGKIEPPAFVVDAARVLMGNLQKSGVGLAYTIEIEEVSVSTYHMSVKTLTSGTDYFLFRSSFRVMGIPPLVGIPRNVYEVIERLFEYVVRQGLPPHYPSMTGHHEIERAQVMPNFNLDVQECVRDIRDAASFTLMEEQRQKRERGQMKPEFTLNLQIYAQEFAESRKNFERVMKIHALKERYKSVLGKPEHVKLEYFTVKYANGRLRFRRHTHKEWWV